MMNTTNRNEEQESEEKKTGNLFFAHKIQTKTPNEFISSSEENDDITPFYVLGYN